MVKLNLLLRVLRILFHFCYGSPPSNHQCLRALYFTRKNGQRDRHMVQDQLIIYIFVLHRRLVIQGAVEAFSVVVQFQIFEQSADRL